MREYADLATLLFHCQWVIRCRWGKYAPVYRLSSQLRAWHASRDVCSQTGNVLTIKDLETIQSMIQRAAVTGLDAVLQDQLFFLAVGALQVQTRTGSMLAWQRFHQAIQLQLGHKSQFRNGSFALVVSLCVLWLTVSPIHQPIQQKATPYALENPLLAADAVDPATLNLLESSYRKMKSGTCQLPQAAMLPESQREAFILFVTQGKVNVEQLERLREALVYVNCLYPQALMRPQGRNRESSDTMHGD